MSDVITVESQIVVSDVDDLTIQINIAEATPISVDLGVPGPAGPAGPAGPQGQAADDLKRDAGENLTQGRAVYAGVDGRVFAASSAAYSTAKSVIGMLVTSALTGDECSIRAIGSYTNNAFTFDPGEPLYLAVDGTPTHTPPMTGVLLRLGVALDAHTLLVDLGQPIVRGG